MLEIFLKILSKYGRAMVLLTTIVGSIAMACYFAYNAYFWSAERTGSPISTIAAAVVIAVVAVILNITCGFVGSGDFDFRWIRYPAGLAASGAIIGAIAGQYPTVAGWLVSIVIGGIITFYMLRQHLSKGQR
jgi:hypothetical protein